MNSIAAPGRAFHNHAARALAGLAILTLPFASLGATGALAASPATAPSAAAAAAARVVSAAADNKGLPFAIVDKKAARIHIFGADGALRGSSAALMGSAPGDRATPGVGKKPVESILPHERTTPSGRFSSQPGINTAGEKIVWFDYAEGLAIHRVRPGASERRRLAALASGAPADSKRSMGCVVVPPSFFDAVVSPLLGRGRGVVYVLPEESAPVAMLAEPAAPLRAPAPL